MITYVEGDLFQSPAHVLVNSVNTVGVMGKGIAKEFKAIYPDMFSIYQERCERGELTVGKLLLYRTPHKWVLNFPTKRHWRQRSRVEDIEAGLKTFVASYAEYSLMSVAFPQLGCGNGELDWESQVRPLMEQFLGSLPIDVYIHVYVDGSLVPEHRDRETMKAWLRSQPKSLPFSEFWDDLVDLVTDESIQRDGIDGWRVALVNDQGMQLLRFQHDGRIIDFNRDDVRDLWQSFRTFGFHAGHELPRDLEPIREAWLRLLAQLSYIEPAAFATLTARPRRESGTTTAILQDDASQGIRLVPPAADAPPISQVALFAGVDMS